MEKIQVDSVKGKVIAPLSNPSPRVILICREEVGLLELPDHCEVTLKIHDGKVHSTNVTEKHLFKTIKIK